MDFTYNRVFIRTFTRGGCVFSRKRRLHEVFTHDVLRGVYNFPNSPENVFLTWAKRNTWLWVSYIRFNALCPWCLDCRGFQGIYHAALTPQNHLGEFHLTVFSEVLSVLVRLIKTYKLSDTTTTRKLATGGATLVEFVQFCDVWRPVFESVAIGPGD